jgi:hypothetical protein
MGKGGWLRTMPLDVSFCAALIDAMGLGVEDEGWLLRQLRRCWVARTRLEPPAEMPAKAREAFDVVWQRIDGERVECEAAYQKRSEAGRKNVAKRMEKASNGSSNGSSIGSSNGSSNGSEQEHKTGTGSRRGTTSETSVVPVTTTVDRTSCAPHSRREREATWLSPFGEAWERATDGTFAYSRAAKPLKRLVQRHGAEAVFTAWCAYLRETETTYLSVDRFAGTYGHWAGTVPEAVARGHDPNRAAVERVRLKIAARQAAAGGAA